MQWGERQRSAGERPAQQPPQTLGERVWSRKEHAHWPWPGGQRPGGKASRSKVITPELWRGLRGGSKNGDQVLQVVWESCTGCRGVKWLWEKCEYVSIHIYLVLCVCVHRIKLKPWRSSWMRRRVMWSFWTIALAEAEIRCDIHLNTHANKQETFHCNKYFIT